MTTKKQTINNIKLGAFTVAGFAFLLALLVWVGRDTNMFSSNFELRARFQNVNGLMPGNNVRFAGIQVGTVKSVTILNDTTIEILLIIDEDVQQFIKKDALVNIGSEGLMGNKIVSIIPGQGNAPTVKDGDLLTSKKNPDTDEMLKILYETNNMVAEIAASVKNTVDMVGNSTTIWSLLNDVSVSDNVKASLSNIRTATEDIHAFMNDLQAIAEQIQTGRGPAGTIINDTAMSANLIIASKEIKDMAVEANKMITDMNRALSDITKEIESSQGTARAVLSDTAMVNRLNRSLENIEMGTKSFNESMEALKHNRLLRGYFKRLENEREAEENKTGE